MRPILMLTLVIGCITPPEPPAVPAALPAASAAPPSPAVNARALYTSGSRLRARVFTAGDGSQEFLGWFDSARSEDCSYRLAVDGSRRCLPTADMAFNFADSACAIPAVPVTCASTSYMLEFVTDGGTCATPGARIFRGGAVSDGGYYSRALDGGCLGPFPGMIRAAGAEISPGEFESGMISVQ